MSDEAIENLLGACRLSVVAGLAADGSPVLARSRYAFDGSDFLVSIDDRDGPEAPRMTGAELGAFLEDYRDPDANCAPFAAVASLKKDGAPTVVPFGYYFDGQALFLSVNAERLLSRRLRRDPRVSVGIVAAGDPALAVVADGVAELIDDPGSAHSRRLFARYRSDPDPDQYEKDLQGWLAHGRLVWRIEPKVLLGTDERKSTPVSEAASGVEAPGDLPGPDPRIALGIYNNRLPATYLMVSGTRELVSDQAEARAVAAEMSSRYAVDGGEQTPAGGPVVRVTTNRVTVWDQGGGA